MIMYFEKIPPPPIEQANTLAILNLTSAALKDDRSWLKGLLEGLREAAKH